MTTSIKAGQRMQLSCIYDDREVTVLEVEDREALVRLTATGQEVRVPLSVLYT